MTSTNASITTNGSSINNEQGGEEISNLAITQLSDLTIHESGRITTSPSRTPNTTISSYQPCPRRLSGGMHENFSPQIIHRLAKEVRSLVKDPPEGIVYIPNEEESLMEIHVDIEGPVGTPYVEGIFRVKLALQKDYPNSPPRGYFLTKIYHPNVANNGDICVNMLKKDWHIDVTLAYVLQVIRCLLIIPFPESSLNDEAGRLFMESYDDYCRRARLYTTVHAQQCKKKKPAAIPSSHASSSSTKDDDHKMSSSSSSLPPPTLSSTDVGCNTSTSEGSDTAEGGKCSSTRQEDNTKQDNRKSNQDPIIISTRDRCKENRKKSLKRL